MTCTTVENKKISDLWNNNDEKSDLASKLVFRDFDTIQVSTKTFIVVTNMTLDIDKLFDYLPFVEYILVPKRRGRKKKNEPADPNKDIQDGSIITLEYQNKIRGVDLKKKKKKNKDNKKRGNYFRNSVTIVMIMDGKKINFKVSRNGKFQMTGCKKDNQAEDCVKCIWKYIKDSTGIFKIGGQELGQELGQDLGQELDTDTDVDTEDEDGNVIQKPIIYKNTPNLKVIFIPAMRNIDFGLNFFVDREKLDEYFNMCTNYHSLLETSFGYTGVNIKIPINKSIEELHLKQIEYTDENWLEPIYVPYSNYLDMLSPKDVAKKLKKQRYNTFLVFHSGKVIMSGMESTFMENVYYEFLDIIRECYDIIEERLEEQTEIINKK
jgi:TATA-box binding protein (TBP) (component of TFIID and TFIIIB)